MLKRVMMIAGEASGDLHGAGVVRELKEKMPLVDIFGIGGDKMKNEGLDCVFHISKLSFMGFVEVVKNLPLIKEVERKLELLLEQRKPDVVVLIDYPGFNLRFAKIVRRHDIKILYYISPQVWAWHAGRVRKMRGVVDRMKVVFPFEVDIYSKERINVEFVGHPLAERIGSKSSRSDFFQQNEFDTSKKLLGLLPGSRKQEIENIFPTMLASAMDLRELHGVQIAVGVAPNLGAQYLRKFSPDVNAVHFVENATYDVMAHSDAVIVTSGTATLETGWFGTPMSVVYRTSAITYTIGRALVGVPFIGLVNIVAGERVVPEFVQAEMNKKNLVREMTRQLTDFDYSSDMRAKLSTIKEKIGLPGASSKVADGIIELGEAK
jgi:lipid-A-disaccharide synthase